MSFMAERTRPEAAAPGINGGQSGAPGEILIDGKPVNPKTQHVVQLGTRVLLRTPGGGGYGDVNARTPELVENDRINGYLS
jgi:N-methylhydantoinase B